MLWTNKWSNIWYIYNKNCDNSNEDKKIKTIIFALNLKEFYENNDYIKTLIKKLNLDDILDKNNEK